MNDIPDLTNEQREELAKCFVEETGIDERDGSFFRHELIIARLRVKELMKIWRFRKRVREANKK